MRKIIFVYVGLLSLLLCACTLQTSDSSIIPENLPQTEMETNMLTVDEIISDIPQNAAYRQTLEKVYSAAVSG